MALFWLFASTFTLGAEPQAINCLVGDSGATLTLSDLKSKSILVSGRSDICDSGYAFFPDHNQPLNGVIFAAPEEIGLNEKNAIFRVSFKNGKVKRIGELPVSSENTSDNIYVNVFQSGGSLFLERYAIEAEAVNRIGSQIELVEEGRLCIDKKDDIWNVEINTAKSCKKFIEASISKPVCLFHKAGKAQLSDNASCIELETRWKKR